MSPALCLTRGVAAMCLASPLDAGQPWACKLDQAKTHFVR